MNLITNIKNRFKSISEVHTLRLISIGTLISCGICSLLLNIIIVLYRSSKPNIIDIIIVVVSCILSIFVAFGFDKWYRNRELKNTHYPYSFKIITRDFPKIFSKRMDICSRICKLQHRHYPESSNIIKKEFLKSFSKKTVLPDYKPQNNEIDKIIKSPLDYALQTLDGNSFPRFNPDYKTFNDIYKKEVKLIVAITAENPNLWLDPTSCFYLINCYVAFFIRMQQQNIGNRMEMENFNELTDEKHKEFRTRHEQSLEKLIKQEWSFADSDFDFFRFFLYDKDQKDCLEKTAFPSLKASHDLFDIKSFFTEIDDIETELKKGENYLPDYYAHIDFLWEEIRKKKPDPSNSPFNRVIDGRKKKHLPEFLALFKKENDKNKVTIHTFVNGNPYEIEFTEDLHNPCGYTIVKSLISYLADSVKKAPRYNHTDEFLNKENSYIKWVPN
ncbi:hypothetical protein FACS189426_04170 [Bacteroidia bacterium]|nr:hypothetical protein FACS189426_04170 [Bacteroidia bacterium]